jgi:regulator of Ty1 transposition protein 103
VDVWRQRHVFEGPILDAVEARVNGKTSIPPTSRKHGLNRVTKFMILLDIDKNRLTTKKQPLGGSFFKDSTAGSTPSELQPLVPLQVALTKAAITSNSSATTANTEYDKLKDPQALKITPPVHAARLGTLLKALAHAENSVSEVIKSRRALIDGLEKLLATNRTELEKEESLLAQFGEKKAETDTKRREVEDAIMRGYQDDPSFSAPGQGNGGEEPPRPEVEALTPPPIEAITPVGSPKPEQSHASHGPFTEDARISLPHGLSLQGLDQTDNDMEFDPSSISPGGENDFDIGVNGAAAKRRKTAHEEDYAEFAGGDLDADVAAMIAQEGKQ